MTDLLISPQQQPGRPDGPSLAANRAGDRLDRAALRELAYHSREVLKLGQAENGALIACPNFPVYRYCWLRDGSFCAHALDRTGQPGQAAAFFRWIGRTLAGQEGKVRSALDRHAAGETLAATDFLNTRYTLEGSEESGNDDWWNFQLDGYGTWLWAFAEHLRRFPDEKLREELLPAVELTGRYLAAFWRLPNYDCWEENLEDIHPATLAAIYGGLTAAARLYPASEVCQQGKKQASTLRRFVKAHGLESGSLVKSLGRLDVDASLLGAGVPYGLFPPRGKTMLTTLDRIANELVAPDGGVYRYRQDVYFGGGEWLLLTAWLGWYYTQAGQRKKALDCLHWVARQARPNGEMPEQVAHHLLASEHQKPWEEKWGLAASPLLWSHAMYLILYTALFGEGYL